jgi:GntR family transcriptional regulator
MISQAGFTPGTRDFRIYMENASKTIAEKLDFQTGSAMVVIDRVRTANDSPVVWTRDIMPQEYLNGWVPTIKELNQRSLYECLEEYTDIRIVSGIASFNPVQANKEIAEKLNIQRNDLLLLIDQVDFDQSQRKVLYSAEYHLTDKFKFIIHRKGPAY